MPIVNDFQNVFDAVKEAVAKASAEYEAKKDKATTPIDMTNIPVIPRADEVKAEEPAKAEEPKVDAPVTEEPKAEEPAKVEEPTTEDAPAEEPTAEEPKADEDVPDDEPASTDAPADEEPAKAEEPKEEPKAEEPKADDPLKKSFENVFDALGQIISGKATLEDLVGQDLEKMFGQTKWAKEEMNVHDPLSPWKNGAERG